MAASSHLKMARGVTLMDEFTFIMFPQYEIRKVGKL